MSRVKIVFPHYNPLHTATIQVRITDINYGNHVGNDALLSIIHEARMQMLAAHNYSEMNAAGNSLIMADVMIAYKNESFYADKLHISIYAAHISTSSFSLLYNITTTRHGSDITIAHAQTGMVCFDYATRRIVPITAALTAFLSPPPSSTIPPTHAHTQV
jgi:acyl-CoA thioester hydrolase